MGDQFQAAHDYFAFLAKKISSQEIQSMIPFFDCEEPGHGGNALDQVCLDQDCRFKGLCCVRCSYQRHRLHPNSVQPLHTFVSQIVQQMSSRKVLLDEQKKKCAQYRDVVISLLRDYLNNLIEHLSIVVASIHKYYTLFENSYENILIKTHVLVHSLIYKKHIQKDKFDKYIRESIKAVTLNREFVKPSVDYYVLSDPVSKAQKYEERFKQENGTIIINEQEKAYEMGAEFCEEMHKVAQKLQIILKQSQDTLFDQVELSRLSPKIPKFEQAQLAEIAQFKKQFNVNDLFKVQSPAATNSKVTSIIPNLTDYLQRENLNTLIDPSRQKCTLGMLFEYLSNCSIMKIGAIKAQLQEISCFSALNSDLIAIGARFSPYIEIHRLQDKKLVSKIDTKSQQGVKCLLVMSRPTLNSNTSAESEATLIVGLYYDQGTLQSYQIQIFKNDNKYTVNHQPSGLFHKTDQNAAATCITEIYNADFFAAGYSTGTVSIYHRENSEPIYSLNYLYEKAVQGISLIEPGKQFISFSQEKSRLHQISGLTQERVVHNITQIRLLANPVYQMIVTGALNDEKSSLQLYHFICGELKEFYQNETREQGLRFLRLMKDDPKQSLVDEGAISNFRELGHQNSVKDMIVLEPRKKMSRIWCIAIGENNRLQLWEIKRAMSQNIKLWEKDLEDFLKPVNHSVIKGKLLAESQEYSVLKYFDVGPKVQILKVSENPANGRFNVLVGVVNHESRSDIDIFDVELMSY